MNTAEVATSVDGTRGGLNILEPDEADDKEEEDREGLNTADDEDSDKDAEDDGEDDRGECIGDVAGFVAAEAAKTPELNTAPL